MVWIDKFGLRINRGGQRNRMGACICFVKRGGGGVMSKPVRRLRTHANTHARKQHASDRRCLQHHLTHTLNLDPIDPSPPIHPLIPRPSPPPTPSAGCIAPARRPPRRCCGGAWPATPPGPQESPSVPPPPPPRWLPAPPSSLRPWPPPARDSRRPLHLHLLTRRVRPRHRRRRPCSKTLGWRSWRRRSRACRSTGAWCELTVFHPNGRPPKRPYLTDGNTVNTRTDY